MSKRGSPEIRVVEFDDYYMAIEGSHRLRAAAELGIPVKLNILSQSDFVQADSLDLEGFVPGESYAAGYIAKELYSQFNPILIVSENGTLTFTEEFNREEP